MFRSSTSRIAWVLAGAVLAAACSDEDTPLEPAADLSLAAPGEAAGTGTVANGRIVYSALVDGDLEIVSVNPNGSDPRRLTRSSGNDFDAAVSPDGRRIAFVSDRGGSTQIWVMSADGSGQRKLTAFGPGSDIAEPAWSPDGRKIAFAGDIPELDAVADHDIYVMSANGRNVTRILGTADDRTDDRQPDWSPDGSKLAATRGGASIIVANADGSDVQPIGPCTPGPCRNPDWSPDGTRIAYEVDVSSGFGRLEVKGTEEPEVVAFNLATGRGGPAWSPDGSRLVYPHTDDGLHARLFTINPDGTAATPVGAATSSDRGASWGRFVR